MRYSLLTIFKRLLWDVLDSKERQYYLYHIIWQIPGLFGSMLRSNFISNRANYCGDNLKIYAGARFRSIEGINIGNNVEIGNDSYIQGLGGVSLGNNVMIAPGVKIWSANHNVWEKEEDINSQGITTKPVKIGNDVFIGANSFILPGVNLPEGCIVTAGSVVGIKAYKPYSLISGNPARIIGNRDSNTGNR